jgi:pimeloyl-ACP methyl ester carboxylesterase
VDLELATTEAGAGGRPLLLVHGFTGGREDFDDHVERFAGEGWHAVAPDLPGHGESHPDGADHGFEAYGEALLGLADGLGWGSFVVIGHSMGGVVAQHLAVHRPERVDAMVLMDTSPGHVRVDPDLVELACGVVGREGMEALLRIQQAMGNPLDTESGRRLRAERPGWAARQDAKFLRCSPAMYEAMARALTAPVDRTDALAAVRVPTLVVVGERDELFRDAARELAAVIPRARLEVVPDAGHSPQVEAPDAWFAVVSEFLRSV